MILSHRHRFIFLKTGKTAGTSIEIALSRFCGPEDIITPIAREDEILRQKLGHPGPQNHLAPLSDYRVKDFLRLHRKRKPRYFNHIRAPEIRALVGEDVWNEYYKFTVVRNPWDRLISSYFWSTKNSTNPPTLDEFIDSDKVQERDYTRVYTIDGEISVDKVCRFERLTEDLEEVKLHLGLPEPITLPKTKNKIRRDKRHYRDLLNAEQKERVASLYKREIDWFNYSF